jgi:hypothetical protein
MEVALTTSLRFSGLPTSRTTGTSNAGRQLFETVQRSEQHTELVTFREKRTGSHRPRTSTPLSLNTHAITHRTQRQVTLVRILSDIPELQIPNPTAIRTCLSETAVITHDRYV